MSKVEAILLSGDDRDTKYDALLELAKANEGKLKPGAELRAVHQLGTQGRTRLVALMNVEHDGQAKGLFTRGALVNESINAAGEDLARAMAFWRLAAATIRKREEAIVNFWAGTSDPGALPDKPLTDRQRTALALGLKGDHSGLMWLISKADGSFLEERAGVLRAGTTEFEVRVHRDGRTELALGSERAPIRLHDHTGQALRAW